LGSVLEPLTNHTTAYYKEKMFKNRKHKKNFEDDLEIGLVERANAFLRGRIRRDGDNRFVGYSDTFTRRAYDFIKNTMRDNPEINQNDIATLLRLQFGEAYKSQANTIVRTEIGHAISLADERMSLDISTYASKASKTWNSLLDSFTRDDHVAVNGETLHWDKKKDLATLTDLRFSNGLRFPRDQVFGTASDVINCRCTIDYDIIEFDNTL